MRKNQGVISDSVAGDPDLGIAPGTPYDWKCPICGASKKTFKPIGYNPLPPLRSRRIRKISANC